MDDRTLADRLVTYADTLVAVSFVGMSGLSLALGDPDVRCSISTVYRPIAVANVVSALLVTGLLLLLRRWEMDLRADAPESPKAARYSARLHVARFAIVWFSTSLAVFTLVASSAGSDCAL